MIQRFLLIIVTLFTAEILFSAEIPFNDESAYNNNSLKDIVILKNGTRYYCNILSYDTHTIQIQTFFGKIAIKKNNIKNIYFNFSSYNNDNILNYNLEGNTKKIFKFNDNDLNTFNLNLKKSKNMFGAGIALFSIGLTLGITGSVFIIPFFPIWYILGPIFLSVGFGVLCPIGFALFGVGVGRSLKYKKNIKEYNLERAITNASFENDTRKASFTQTLLTIDL